MRADTHAHYTHTNTHTKSPLGRKLIPTFYSIMQKEERHFVSDFVETGDYRLPAVAKRDRTIRLRPSVNKVFFSNKAAASRL